MNTDIRFLAPKLVEIGKESDMALQDAFELCRQIEVLGASFVGDEDNYKKETIFIPDHFNLAHKLVKEIRGIAAQSVKKDGRPEMLELYKKTLLFDAKYDFDTYCMYLEFNREKTKRFYLPRRKQLLPMVRELQRLADGELKLLGLSCPPGIGKTTLALFYLSWIGGKNPELTILGGSHSNSFLRGVYEEIQRIVTPGGEYLWNDVFPDVKVSSTNAKDMRLNLGKRKRFETFEFSSIGSGNAGKVRASNLLYCDDLVDGLETALSPERLDKLWQQYYTDLRQRKIGSCVELHIATRWSLGDVLSRLNRMYEGDPGCKFISFPAVDENGESLWDYPYNLGFTTQFYKEQKEIMDEASWSALFMNDPIERNGLLYDKKELRRYFELPEREPDAILAVCDTKNMGGDYCAMPIAYQYGNDFYIDKFIHDNRNPEIIDPRIVEALLSRNVDSARFESNSAGERIAENIQKQIKDRGGKTKITTKWNQKNKETRILIASAWVKEHCLFKDESLYKDDKEYRDAMRFVTGYTMAGKNKHDDAVDALAMLYDFVENMYINTAEIFKRPF